MSRKLSQANRVVERCVSTNDLARTLGEEGAPHGTWVSARIQEGGRGRLGRNWESLEENLFLSIIVRLENKSLWTWVPLATAVGVARSVRALFPQLEVKIKWPNDLMLEGAKLCGILCEAVGDRSDSFIIIGLGLNTAHAPQGLNQETISLSQALAPRKILADDIREEIIQGVLAVLAEMSEKGTEVVNKDFMRYTVSPEGTLIQWRPSNEESPIKSGVVQGLGSMGELVVTSIGEGETIRLYAEDIKIQRSDSIL